MFNWLRRALTPSEKDVPWNEAEWAKVLAYPLFHGLSEEERALLEQGARHFLTTKSLIGVGGLTVTDRMRLTVAAQAILPILHLDLRSFDDWSTVVLYPTPFRVRDPFTESIGAGLTVVHEEERIEAGQARSDGPVLLSWPDVRHGLASLDGFNVVIHEIAHKLDMLNGDANGYPPLHRGMDRQRWAGHWSAAYREICQTVDSGEDTGWLDPYAAESPAECFAVLSEAFFEWPDMVALDFPDLYAELSAFYRQDPRVRLAPVLPSNGV